SSAGRAGGRRSSLGRSSRNARPCLTGARRGGHVVRDIPRRSTDSEGDPLADGLFRTKSIDRLLADSAETGDKALKRTLGPWSLIALGIGAIIGAGLFVRTAAAIADRAGPSVTIAFVVAGLGRRLPRPGRPGFA